MNFLDKLANDKIIYKVSPPVAYIIINRPEKRNAMTYNMWRALYDAYSKSCTDDNIKIVVLRGQGGSLSAGDDIKEMLDLNDTQEARKFFQVLREVFRIVLECPKITVAIVDGPAVGGGAELLLAMDYVIAIKEAYVGFPEIHIGLIPPILATLGIYILGLRNAKKLALTGKFLNAEEAYNLGIFDEIVDKDDLENVLQKTINTYIAVPQEPIKSIKKLTLLSTMPAYENGMSELIQLVMSREAKTRMKKFLEKKLPRPI